MIPGLAAWLDLDMTRTADSSRLLDSVRTDLGYVPLTVTRLALVIHGIVNYP